MKLPAEYRHREGIGEEVRFNCPNCGDTRERLYVRQTRRGWFSHCHNCAPAMSGFTPDSELLTPEEIKRELEKPTKDQVVKAGEVRLPSDFTTEIPMRGLAWLYKYGITDEEIRTYGFGYSKYLHRLILPVYSNGALIYWQGRALGEDQKPKYVNVRVVGRDVYFRINTLTDNSCCLVEDIVSAVKVARVIPSIGLLGSYIPLTLTNELVKFDRIYLWLDEDKWKESIKYATRMSALLGKPVVPIRTELDPKCYDTIEIRKVLAL